MISVESGFRTDDNILNICDKFSSFIQSIRLNYTQNPFFSLFKFDENDKKQTNKQKQTIYLLIAHNECGKVKYIQTLTKSLAPNNGGSYNTQMIWSLVRHNLHYSQ